MAESAFSAPGKALLAGGYLVLMPEYSAYSLALSSRMHAVVRNAPTANSLVISSPQFASQWSFTGEDGLPIEGTHPNPFLEAVVRVIHAYFSCAITGSVEIWSDSGFHSQEKAVASPLERFSSHNRPIIEVAKTGLGSSAALCTVVTAALVHICEGSTDTLDLKKVHNLAQIAHCAAQKKVGSGFDVASAVYGSIVYSRFDPDVIPSELTPQRVKESVNKSWESSGMRIEPCVLPKSVAIVMGDVQGGSETPGLVRRMLAWRKENSESAHEIWTALNEANMDLSRSLSMDSEANNASFDVLRTKIQAIRLQLQRLSKASGIPVEPPEQTALLDKAAKVAGVINGVVPGAGGYDAVSLLVDALQVSDIVDALNVAVPEANWTHLFPEDRGLVREPVEAYIPQNRD